MKHCYVFIFPINFLLIRLSTCLPFESPLTQRYKQTENISHAPFSTELYFYFLCCPLELTAKPTGMSVILSSVSHRVCRFIKLYEVDCQVDSFKQFNDAPVFSPSV